MKIVKSVPFFAYTQDNTHCYQSVLKMILKYFEPDKEYSYEELDILSGKVPGKWTWDTRAIINMKKMAFQVLAMDNFDYLKFSLNARDYMNSRLGFEAAAEQEKHSDFIKEMKDAKEYYQELGNSKKIPEISDIKRLIREGYLVSCNINGRTLRGRDGYSGHFVLVVGFTDNTLIIHNPGTPPVSNQEVDNLLFTRAWAFPSHDRQNLTAFKK